MEIETIGFSTLDDPSLAFSESHLDLELDQRLGAFVTLRKQGRLRGCLGRTSSSQSLVETVARLAGAAACRDPRFSPVEPEELHEIRIEVSVLGPTFSCSADQIVLGRDGLVLKAEGASALFLPEVPIEAGWSVNELLEALCKKAGLPVGSWREGASLQRFESVHFEEPGPGLGTEAAGF